LLSARIDTGTSDMSSMPTTLRDRPGRVIAPPRDLPTGADTAAAVRPYHPGVMPRALNSAYGVDVSIVGRLGGVTRRHPNADAGVAAVALAVTLMTTVAGPAGGWLDAHAVTLAVLASAALVVRRRAPVAVLLVSTLAAELYLAHYGGRHGQMVLVAPLIALYTVAETSTGRRGLLIGVLGVVAFGGVHMLLKPTPPLGAENLALAALGALAVAAGRGSRMRSAYQAEVESRALRAEADREAEAARRVTEERLRIARDLHDAVGHHLALIRVQAGVAAHVLDTPPQRAAEALEHIRVASKAALDELRDTVGLLREPGDRPPVDPVPGLAGIDDLLASFRRSGLTVRETVDGAQRPVPPAADVTAYRVIQESLTNACKHTGPTTVTVRLTYRPDGLHISVHNGPSNRRPGPGAAGGPGHGLAGMRERVSALGGRLQAGGLPGGGFEVTAVLPYAAPAVPPAPAGAGPPSAAPAARL
jgi:signal transduction histidine kinase